MELYLIRHAQSANNALPREDRVEDPPLTETGRQQCAHLAACIPELRLTRLVTSPFLRTLETSKIIKDSVGLTVEVRVELHEQGGCVSGHLPGKFVGCPGMTAREIRTQFAGFQIAPNIGDQGWWRSRPFESEVQARRRAGELLDRTISEFAHTAERVAYVMHGDIKRLVLSHLLDEPLETPYNTAVTKIEVGRGGCQLTEYNCIDHLPAALVTV